MWSCFQCAMTSSSWTSCKSYRGRQIGLSWPCTLSELFPLGHLPFDPIRPMHAKLVVPSLRHLLQYSLESLALGPILLGIYLLVPSLRHLLQYSLESFAENW